MPASPAATLLFSSDLALLPVVRQFIDAFARLGGLDPDSIDAIVLATNEATSNVIRHTYQSRPNEKLRIECRVVADGLEVEVSDEGEPFNVCDVPDLDPAEPRIGGRGVFLIRTLVDELVHTSREEGGNTLRMVRRRRK
jgi:anti-sigma regulatory factor (Ser/Thr protein kinase)